jgi:hypothetical protein
MSTESAQSGGQSDTQSDAEPRAHSDAQPDTPPGAQPSAQPDAQSRARPCGDADRLPAIALLSTFAATPLPVARYAATLPRLARYSPALTGGAASNGPFTSLLPL